MYKQHAGKREIIDYKNAPIKVWIICPQIILKLFTYQIFCQNFQHETMQYRCLNISQHLQTYILCIHYTHVYVCRKHCGLDNIIAFSLETAKTKIKKTATEIG